MHDLTPEQAKKILPQFQTQKDRGWNLLSQEVRDRLQKNPNWKPLPWYYIPSLGLYKENQLLFLIENKLLLIVDNSGRYYGYLTQHGHATMTPT